MASRELDRANGDAEQGAPQAEPDSRALLRGLAARFALEAAASGRGTAGERAWHEATAIVKAMEDKVWRARRPLIRDGSGPRDR